MRAVFGGRLREALSGAAPISKEILEFFFAAGAPVMEGYGMTETSTGATFSTPEHHRFGSIGKPLPGVDVKVADDGELLVKGPNIFAGYYHNDDASFGAVIDGWLHTGDLGQHRRGRLRLHRRPQEGHHHYGRRQEHHAGEPRERDSSSRAGSRRR